MTRTYAVALATAINQEYPGVDAVALDVGRDHWVVRVINRPFATATTFVRDVFETARAAQRIYPTWYGEALAQEESQGRMAS